MKDKNKQTANFGGTFVIKKHYYSWTDTENMCTNIVKQMYADNWRPDYIVGLTRGGNIPATIISNMLDIRCEAMKVSFRNDDRVDTNFWLSRHATDSNILIVDDINDSGTTFKVVTDIFKNRRLNHRTAALINKEKSDFDVDFYGEMFYHDDWITFPWEK